MDFKNGEDDEHLIQALRARLAGHEKQLEDQRGMRRFLHQSQDRYRTVFENTGTATLVMDGDTRITMVNSGFERLTGLRKELVEGKRRLDEIFYAADRQRMVDYGSPRSDAPETPRMLDSHIQDDQGQIKIDY
ncbi:MAG: PAS domain S-box protein [Desulfobacterales bacterium]|jgi:PAS domain S-box-containing protein